MRFRPANISLINRRHYLPRPRLTLSSKKQKQKPPQRFADVDRVTPYHFRIDDDPTGALKNAAIRGFIAGRGMIPCIVIRACERCPREFDSNTR